jgi:hypothetical protein
LVLLDIYRQRYFEADEQGDEAECKRIALEIIKTVRLQCVPQGRFLQQDARDQWHEMNELVSFVSIVEGEIIKNACSSKHGERPAKRAHTSASIDIELPSQAAIKKIPRELYLVDEPKPFDVICESDLITFKANAHHMWVTVAFKSCLICASRTSRHLVERRET